MIIKDLGAVSAYAYAVEKGYTGTEEEFETLMASYATVAEEAAESAESASQSATQAGASAQTATTKASEASTAAQTATAKAEEAQADADAAALDASQALSAASTATTKASEAAQSASDAVAAKTAAQTAQTAAEGSATTAQTAAQTATQKAAEAAESARTLTIDPTLTQSGQAADSKVVGDEIGEVKSALNYNKMATAGYILTATNDGTGQTWSPVGTPTDEQTAEAVTTWLANHPEATTTVQNGAITEAKLSDALKLKTINNYVTPEMFGAKGTGLASDIDDDALAAALSSGYPVLLLNKYAISKPLVLNNVFIIGNGAIYDFATGYEYGVKIENNCNIKNLSVISRTRSSGCAVLINSTFILTDIDGIYIELNHNADGFVIDGSSAGFAGGSINNAVVQWAKNAYKFILGSTGWLTALKMTNCSAVQYSECGFYCDYDDTVKTYQFTQNVFENFTFFNNVSNGTAFHLCVGNNTFINPVVFSDNTEGVCYALDLPTTNKREVFWTDKFVGGMMEGRIKNIDYIVNYNIMGTTFILRDKASAASDVYIPPKFVDLIGQLDFNDNANVALETINTSMGKTLKISVTGENSRIRASIPAELMPNDTNSYSVFALIKTIHNGSVSTYLATLSILLSDSTAERFNGTILNPINNAEKIDIRFTTITNTPTTAYRYINIGTSALVDGDVAYVYSLKFIKGNLNRFCDNTIIG